MCVCIYIICMYVMYNYGCIYTYIYIERESVFTPSIHTHIYIYIHLYIDLSMFTDICMCVYVYIYIYIYIYIGCELFSHKSMFLFSRYLSISCPSTALCCIQCSVQHNVEDIFALHSNICHLYLFSMQHYRHSI